ncbi:glycosyltransferase family 2 protein, partial [Patescibacteria group bacterium]|nr:glycosyltransferase family 2 protein [Patescibacteria group bacterium]
MKIVVIIPTYNERENIDKMIEVLEKEIFPKIKKHEMWILVVDDRSPDGTVDIARKKMKKYENIELSLGKKEGLGAAYIRGMKYAMEKMKADAVIEFDADFQHDPKHIPELVKKFDQGYDYVIGSRFVKGGTIPKEWSFYRKFLTIYGGLFTRFVLFFPNINKIKDTTTGLKLTRVKGVLDKIDFSKISKGFCYKTEILYQIANMGAKITEVPIHFRVRTRGGTKMPFSNVIKTFLMVIQLRLQNPKTLQFIKFAVVGFIGYLVNAIGLEAFYRAGLSPGPATAVATELAI